MIDNLVINYHNVYLFSRHQKGLLIGQMNIMLSDFRRHVKVISDVATVGFQPVLKEYDVKGVTHVGPSPISGNGVFASRDITSGTRLIGTEDRSYYYMKIDRSFSSFVNDGDMIYPKDWSYEGLLNTFALYNSKNNCNIDMVNMITIKDIKKGEEMASHYGSLKWLGWMLMDLNGSNPFSHPPNFKPINKKSKISLREATENLFAVAAVLGYSALSDRFDQALFTETTNGAGEALPSTIFITAVVNAISSMSGNTANITNDSKNNLEGSTDGSRDD